jgi:hypothetical protein
MKPLICDVTKINSLNNNKMLFLLASSVEIKISIFATLARGFTNTQAEVNGFVIKCVSLWRSISSANVHRDDAAKYTRGHGKIGLIAVVVE